MSTWRALVLGLASGGRGTLAFAGPALLAPGAGRLRRGIAGVALAGELIGDTLPSTPARTEPWPLLGRALAGAAAGRAVGGPGAPRSALVGTVAAVAGAVGGVAWRSWSGRRIPALAGAAVEDVVVLGLAAVACRGVGGTRRR